MSVKGSWSRVSDYAAFADAYESIFYGRNQIKKTLGASRKEEASTLPNETLRRRIRREIPALHSPPVPRPVVGGNGGL